MLGPGIKLNKDLWAKVKRVAAAGGYSSPEEFVVHVLEREIARLADQAGIDLAKRKVRAHLYSFRLFVDEPFLIFRAQKELLIWNGRYLALLARPAVIMTIPTLVL